jgi:hypothetical protein
MDEVEGVADGTLIFARMFARSTASDPEATKPIHDYELVLPSKYFVGDLRACLPDWGRSGAEPDIQRSLSR